METPGRKPLNQLPASKMLACAITGNEKSKRDLVRLDTLRPGLIELEIRHLHEKLDHLITKQWQRLAEIQQLQLEIMQERPSKR
jgi:uncharacterized membrane protein